MWQLYWLEIAIETGVLEKKEQQGCLFPALVFGLTFHLCS
jgi:hypothetical protein